MMKRFKNYGLWLAISALLVDILIFSNVINVSDAQEIEMLVQRFLELLVVGGILNNPSKGKGFKDKGSDT